MQTDWDADGVSHFERHTVPTTPLLTPGPQSSSGLLDTDLHATSIPHDHNSSDTAACFCSLVVISRTSPTSRKITPGWCSMPGWDQDWSVMETKREEGRRLVWSALILGIGQMNEATVVGERPLDLNMSKPWQVRVLPFHSVPSSPIFSSHLLPGHFPIHSMASYFPERIYSDRLR